MATVTHGVAGAEVKHLHPSTTQPDNFTTESEDVIIGYDLGKNDAGEVTESFNVYPYSSDKEKAKVQGLIKAEPPKFRDLLTITSQTSYPKTFAGLLALATDDEKKGIVVDLFNNGAAGKVNSRRRRTLKEATTKDKDGNDIFDDKILTNNVLVCTDEILSPKEKIGLTEEEKFIRFLDSSNIQGAKREQMLSVYRMSNVA